MENFCGSPDRATAVSEGKYQVPEEILPQSCSVGHCGDNDIRKDGIDCVNIDDAPAEAVGDWDAELGIWRGARDPRPHALPSPLYLFGYGSLLWRPGELLETLSAYKCVAYGFTRLFAQRSCDHRGTPKMPGLVVTLVKSDELQEVIDEADYKAELAGDLVRNECPGLVWHVPDDRAQSLIEELDFREKGGYSRVPITVRLGEDTKHNRAGESVTAIVYIGSIANPLFDLTLHERIGHCKSRRRLVDIIGSAVGPSGPNCEYLYGLESFLLKNGLQDPYIFKLAADVRIQQGSWRGWRSLLSRNECYRSVASGAGLDVSEFARNNGEEADVVGWGSNEHAQLGKISDGEGGADLLLFAKQLRLPYQQHVQRECTVEEFQFICGATYTGQLWSTGVLILWGDSVQALVPADTVCSSDQEKYQSLYCSENSDEENDGALCFSNVENCSIGHDCVHILFKNGYLVGLGNDAHGLRTARGQLSFLVDEKLVLDGGNMLTLNRPAGAEGDRVLKVCSSVRHGVAMTSERLHVWGHPRYGRVVSPNATSNEEDTADSSFAVSEWVPESGSKLVDVACGLKHTTVLDSLGRVWALGSNKYFGSGKFTDETNPRTVGLKEDLFWNKVSRGIR
jgi:cation transport protein ChaC